MKCHQQSVNKSRKSEINIHLFRLSLATVRLEMWRYMASVYLQIPSPPSYHSFIQATSQITRQPSRVGCYSMSGQRHLQISNKKTLKQMTMFFVFFSLKKKTKFALRMLLMDPVDNDVVGFAFIVMMEEQILLKS